MSEVIYENKERNIVIQCDTTCTAAFVALLERTVWGTHGVLYMTHDVAPTLRRIAEPYFLTLTENGELIAVAVRARKIIRVGDEVYQAFHLALLAVDPARIGRGYGKLLAAQSRSYFLRKVGERGMLYGYIEAGNARSLALNKKLGYQPIGLFHTKMFSRLWPQDDAHVRRVKDTEREALVQLLNDQYADHALLDFEQSVKVDDYYVWSHAGEIIAGVQAERLHWSIRRLPGASGMIMVKVLPHIPILRYLFSAKDYHFLRLGNVYVQTGHEVKVFTLIEALLARQHLHSGVIFIDERSPACQRIAQAGKYGMLNTGISATLHVIADFHGVPDEKIAEIRRRPLCISPMDVV